VPTTAKSFVCAVLALFAVALTACGIGASSPRSGGTQLAVTRDFGQRAILHGSEEPIPGGETVMRLLMRKAEVDTRYGGRFVEAIGGIRSNAESGRRSDWFYYVNGIEAEVGAAERDVEPGDRVWWDYHDWSDAMRVPAVVGSFPEPFRHGSEGKLFPVRIDCAKDADAPCDEAAKQLDRAGVQASTTAIGAATGKEVLRLVVGQWQDVRRDAAALQIEQGPGKSGVFARFGAGGGKTNELDLLDAQSRPVRTLGSGAGLVAATRFEEQQPTWIVTGTDAPGLDAAVLLLDRRILRDRFAVATDGRAPIALPLSKDDR
jgi:uncharacterized protein DUF4430